jgi:hypothetical protein
LLGGSRKTRHPRGQAGNWPKNCRTSGPGNE